MAKSRWGSDGFSTGINNQSSVGTTLQTRIDALPRQMRIDEHPMVADVNNGRAHKKLIRSARMLQLKMATSEKDVGNCCAKAEW